MPPYYQGTRYTLCGEAVLEDNGLRGAGAANRHRLHNELRPARAAHRHLRLALIAGNASTDRFVADPRYFTFYTVSLQLRRYFSQRGGGIAILARTSVDE